MKPTLRISPSMLEEWRLTLEGAFNKDEKTLKRYIFDQQPPTLAMKAGTACHKAIENGFEDSNLIVLEDGTKFRTEYGFTVCLNELRGEIEKNEGKQEQWAMLDFDLGEYAVEMLMRIDLELDRQLVDFKFSSRKKKFTDYFFSFQHRCYLLAVPSAKDFIYACYEIGIDEQDDEMPHNLISMKDYDEFLMPRQNDNGFVIKDSVRNFIRFIEDFGWMYKFIELSQQKRVYVH